MRELCKHEIAQAQLERAVILALDNADSISAVTLAGAADEILGSLLRQQGRQTTYGVLRQLISDIHGKMRKEKWSSVEFNELVNGVRNHFKHFSGCEKVWADPEQEACNLIHRAISNYTALGNEKTEIMERWINESQHLPQYDL